jgi:hypothetical protein
MEDDDVGLHGRQVEAHQRARGERLGRAARVVVVVGETRAMVLRREQRRRGEESGPGAIAPPSMRRCRVAARSASRVPASERSARRAQAFRERHRDEVERLRELGLGPAAATLAFHTPRAVEEGRDPALAVRARRCERPRPAGRRCRLRLCVFSISTSVVGG